MIKHRVAKLESQTGAFIKSLTDQEIEDILRDNLTPTELAELGIAPKIAPLEAKGGVQ